LLHRLLSFDFRKKTHHLPNARNQNLIVDVAKSATLKALNISFVEFFDNFYDRIIKGSVEKSRQPNVVENFQT